MGKPTKFRTQQKLFLGKLTEFCNCEMFPLCVTVYNLGFIILLLSLKSVYNHYIVNTL